MKKQYKTFLLWAVVFLMMALVMGSLTKEKTKGKTITFSEFIPLVKDGKVKSVKFQKPDIIRVSLLNLMKMVMTLEVVEI